MKVENQLNEGSLSAIEQAREAALKRKQDRVSRGETVDQPFEKSGMIPLERIVAKEQPRTDFAPALDKDLVENIQSLRNTGGGIEGSGILQPLLLRTDPYNPSRYFIVAGERRYRAAKTAGLPKVPAIIQSMTADDAYMAAIIENLQRKDLAPIEEARAFDEVIRKRNMSQSMLAKILGVSSGYITNRLRLLGIGEDVQEMVEKRADTLSVATLINGVSDKTARKKLINDVVEHNAPVSQIKAEVAKLAERGAAKNITYGRKSDKKLPAFDYADRVGQAASFISSTIIAANDVPPVGPKKSELLRQLDEVERLAQELRLVIKGEE